MKALIQRVSSAKVEIEGRVAGEIKQGLVILLGVGKEDDEDAVLYSVRKCCELRIFEDDEGKMNRSLLDVNGEALVISQFTLHANTRKGRRPSFTDAAVPELAIPLYESFLQKLQDCGVRKVASGEFGADMQVCINNDGPVTIMLDSNDSR